MVRCSPGHWCPASFMLPQTPWAALRGGVFPTAGGNQAKEGQQSSKIPFESAAVKRVYMPTAGGDSLLSLSPLIWRMGRIPTPISLAGNTY